MRRCPPERLDMDLPPATSLQALQQIQSAAADHQPNPPQERRGVGLCLSGGGFRAALFHLGALRRLDELGALAQIDTLCSVSGGSIIAAFLASRIVATYKDRRPPAAGSWFTDWEGQVAAPFRALLGRDFRTGPLLARFLPWNWFRPSTSVRALATLYERRLTPLKLVDLPARPRFVLCATDLVFGVNWVFERGRLGDYQAGYCTPPADWPLARSVAASSCFPPVFPPLPLGLPASGFGDGHWQGPDRERLVGQISLSDGGVYDNFGLEPVWKDHATVLVSDGGAPFDYQVASTPLSRVFRYTAIIQNQAIAMRKRWLMSDLAAGVLQGTYWGVAGAPSRYDTAAQGYSKDLAMKVIGTIRTDLDPFTEGEMAVLENHGYLLADVALRRYVPSLFGTAPPPLAVPHEGWMDEGRVRAALADSHQRFSWWRWLTSGTS
jgi:NTE family protein